MNDSQLDDLIQRKLDGCATPTETQRLATLLANDAAARARHEELATVFTALGARTLEAPPAGLSAEVLRAVRLTPETARRTARATPAAGTAEPRKQGVLQLLTNFLTSPMYSYRQRARRAPITRSTRGGLEMANTRNLIVGGIVVVAAALGIATVTGKFPIRANGPSEGTIGAAKRTTSDQISSSDVQVNDADIQAFLQSDTFHKIQTDADFRKVVTEGLGKAMTDGGLGRYGTTDGFQKMVTDAGVQKAITSGELGRLIIDPGFQKLVTELSARSLDAKSLDAKSLAGKSLDAKSLDARSLAGKSLDAKSLDAKSLDAKSLDARSLDARSLDARSLAARGAELGMNKANIASLDRMLTDGFGKMLIDPGAQKAIMDPGFARMITDPGMAKMITDESFAKMITNDSFNKMIADPAFGKAITDAGFQRAMTAE